MLPGHSWRLIRAPKSLHPVDQPVSRDRNTTRCRVGLHTLARSPTFWHIRRGGTRKYGFRPSFVNKVFTSSSASIALRPARSFGSFEGFVESCSDLGSRAWQTLCRKAGGGALVSGFSDSSIGFIFDFYGSVLEFVRGVAAFPEVDWARARRLWRSGVSLPRRLMRGWQSRWCRRRLFLLTIAAGFQAAGLSRLAGAATAAGRSAVFPAARRTGGTMRDPSRAGTAAALGTRDPFRL